MSEELVSALARLDRAVTEFRARVPEAPASENLVMGPPSEADEGYLSEVRSASVELGTTVLLDFFAACAGVVLADVHYGYFIHTPQQTSTVLQRVGPRRLGSTEGPKILPFGSDGGGTLFALDEEARVLELPPGGVFDAVYVDVEVVRNHSATLLEFVQFLERGTREAW